MSRGALAAVLLLLGSCSVAPQPAPEPPSAAGARSELVVCVHGLGRLPGSLSPVTRYLQKRGYRTLLWGYASLSGTLEGHGEELARELERLDRDPTISRIDIVTHSLGGIVARHALMVAKLHHLGRVVMLAPPNQGSASARFWARFLGGAVPALPQLSDVEGSEVHRIGVPHGVEIGVIAGDWDNEVTVPESHLPNEADHWVAHSGHTFIMRKRRMQEQILAFLRNGSFQHGERTDSASARTQSR